MVLPVNQPSRITVVSGLPRSGTSLMMQMLAAGGVPVLQDAARPPDDSNRRGYFEFAPVKRLRTDQSWLPSAAGRAVKIIHLLLAELPRDGRFCYDVLLMKRPLSNIIASQQVMLERQGKAAADEKLLLQVYQQQLGQVEHLLRTNDCFRFAAVDYPRLIEAPAQVAEKVKAFLQRELDTTAMAAAVDRTLYHHQTGETAE